MMRAAFAIGLAVSLAAATASADPPPSPEVATTPALSAVERGHDIVQRNCGMCHAIEATGDSPNPAAPRFRELNRRYPLDQLGESLTEGIRTHPNMPEFEFDGAQTDDIIAYLQSIQSRQSASQGSTVGS